MSKDNIYDKIISELILRIAALSTVYTPSLTISNNIGTQEVPAGYSGNIVFTSTVANIPVGYSITASSHIISYPSDPDTIGSTATATGPAIAVALVTAGNTYTVTSTVTLSNGVDPDIILNATHVITATQPAYFGVKVYSATPVVAGLTAMASSSLSFQLTSTSIGRVYIVVPTTNDPLIAVVDNNGNTWTIANDFSQITVGSDLFYQLNYDTQFTGTNIKTFTLIY
jgi:hypothetical protein